MQAPTLQLLDVHQVYPGHPPVRALDGLNLTISPGDFLAVEGPSGSGKSTLLNTLALLDTPTGGDYLIDGRSVTRARERERSGLRCRLFGFVFQAFHLLDDRPVLDSVELGLLYRGVPRRVRRSRAIDALGAVGLADKAGQRAGALSGGERQRVALARVVAAASPVIVADEPTGNLDAENAGLVVGLLGMLSSSGVTVVLVTHDPAVAAVAHRRIRMRGGRMVAERGGSR